MTKYFNSGLYMEAFYTRHEIELYYKDYPMEYKEHEHSLLAKCFKKNFGMEYKSEDDESEQVDQTFWEDLSYRLIYFEPLIFNEEIALECGLTSFTYDGMNLLAVSGCTMDFSPKLDAYQVLTAGSIDKHSSFFSDSDYFESVVGKETTAKLLQVIS